MTAPVLESLNPATVDISAGDSQTVTITGSLFEVSSLVAVNGTDVTSGAYVSDTEMTFEVNTLLAPDAGTVDVEVKNGVEASNSLPLTLTGTPAVGNPNFIPDTPAEGASPNTEAERAEYMSPEPPDVYRQQPVQFTAPGSTAPASGEPQPHTPSPEELPTTNANEDGGLPTNPREPYPIGRPQAKTFAEINGVA